MTIPSVPNQLYYPLSWSGTPLSGIAQDYVNNPSTEAKSGLELTEIGARLDALHRAWEETATELEQFG